MRRVPAKSMTHDAGFRCRRAGDILHTNGPMFSVSVGTHAHDAFVSRSCVSEEEGSSSLRTARSETPECWDDALEQLQDEAAGGFPGLYTG